MVILWVYYGVLYNSSVSSIFHCVDYI